MKTLIAALALTVGVLPAVAQVTPPTPPAPITMTPPVPPMPPRGMRAFVTMSEAGRQAMMVAMQGNRAADRADRERVRTSRDRMLGVVEAERLDTAALRRAMDEERDAANAIKARRQAALATALTSLSVADRRAFVEDARGMRERIERRVERRVERRGERRMRQNPGDVRMLSPQPAQ